MCVLVGTLANCCQFNTVRQGSAVEMVSSQWALLVETKFQRLDLCKKSWRQLTACSSSCCVAQASSWEATQRRSGRRSTCQLSAATHQLPKLPGCGQHQRRAWQTSAAAAAVAADCSLAWIWRLGMRLLGHPLRSWSRTPGRRSLTCLGVSVLLPIHIISVRVSLSYTTLRCHCNPKSCCVRARMYRGRGGWVPSLTRVFTCCSHQDILSAFLKIHSYSAPLVYPATASAPTD